MCAHCACSRGAGGGVLRALGSPAWPHALTHCDRRAQAWASGLNLTALINPPGFEESAELSGARPAICTGGLSVRTAAR
jgi:hypothetical protein